MDCLDEWKSDLGAWKVGWCPNKILGHVPISRVKGRAGVLRAFGRLLGCWWWPQKKLKRTAMGNQSTGDSWDIAEDRVTLLLWEHGKRRRSSEIKSLAKAASTQCTQRAACLSLPLIVNVNGEIKKTKRVLNRREPGLTRFTNETLSHFQRFQIENNVTLGNTTWTRGLIGETCLKTKPRVWL